jgi:hypothetical protein
MLCGAAVNVGIAWACVLTSSVDSHRARPPTPRERELWVRDTLFAVSEGDDVGIEVTLLTVGDSEVMSVVFPGPLIGRLNDANYDLVLRVCAGWPCRSLCGEVEQLGVRSNIVIIDPLKLNSVGYRAQSIKPNGVIVLSDSKSLRIRDVLPIRIRWSGFIANSLLFGLLPLVMYWVCNKVRQRLLLTIGTCPVCAYHLDGPSSASIGCPECGWRR